MPILFALSDRQLWQLARMLQPAAFRKGATVFRAGDPADEFYIVQSGAFTCFTSEREGGGMAPRMRHRGARGRGYGCMRSGGMEGGQQGGAACLPACNACKLSA